MSEAAPASMAHQPAAPPRVALVTGAAHGIGLATAAKLHGVGYRVVLVDSNPIVHARATALGENAAGMTARGFEADVAHGADIKAAVQSVRSEEGRLHALVSNAGIMIRKKVTDLTLEEWSRVLATNLTSAFLFAREAATLLQVEGGSLVTVASTRAHMSEPDTESYAAAKGGLVALTHALAISLGPKIRVNVVSPGWIDVAGEALRPQDHAQHPAGRVGKPEDVAAMISWLLDPGQAFVTGAEFVIDGGMTRKMIYAA
jgi:NAD(P)-dependent dehydrogenase (short-subunit alcohol dehydrogenase family)